MQPTKARVSTAVLALLLAGCATPLGGVRSGAEVLATDIYRSLEWTVRLPGKAVMPFAVRQVVKSYIEDLEIGDDVKRRLEERIDRDEFMDSTVPFLLHLSELYSTSRETETFEQHVRAEFDELRSLPGFEHARFRWEEQAPEAAENAHPEAAADDERVRAVVIGGIVEIYDALFIENASDPLRTLESCTPETIERASVLVCALLESLAEQLPPGELREGLSKLSADEERIEALTISLGELIGEFAHRSFQRFLRLATREAELREWMLGELEKDGFGRLEDYLMQAPTRRHAVLICVDGLQGHLVRALAGGGPEDGNALFIRKICEESSECEAAQPSGPLE